MVERLSQDRTAGSVRRTSSIDIEALAAEPATLRFSGRSRDALTLDPAAPPTPIARALVRATVGAGVVESLSVHPHVPGADQLVGKRLAVGFRTAIWRNLREEYDAGTPLHALLDELPGAHVISGFAVRRLAVRRLAVRRLAAAAGPAAAARPGVRRLDVCAGWAADSEAAAEYRATGQSPPPLAMPLAPPRPALGADAAGWHTLAPLRPGSMSRRRRLDVWLDGAAGIRVDAVFRDVFCDDDGAERTLHEYAVQALVDAATFEVTQIEATPVLLPHTECPSTAGTAQAMISAPVRGLRERVSMDLFGPSCCTHLNDLLRTLADVPVLAASLPD